MENVLVTIDRAPVVTGGIVEGVVVVHGLDIAEATGQDAIDEELCADRLHTMRDLGIDSFRVPGHARPRGAGADLRCPAASTVDGASGTAGRATDSPVPVGR